MTHKHVKVFTAALCAAVIQLPALADKPVLPLEVERNVSFETDEGTWLSVDMAPDGGSIVFDLLGDIYSLDAQGGGAKPLLTGMAFEGQSVFSPDGAKIAFISDRGGSINLWIANRDGSEPKQITHDKGLEVFSSPAWAPDGERIYVERLPKSFAKRQLWMYMIAGGSGVKISDDAQSIMGPAPSPDGKYLYYAVKVSNDLVNVKFPLWDVRRRNLVTGEEELVVAANGSAIAPALSPDGRYLAYATRIEGDTGLRLRNLDTGEDRLLAYPVQRDEQESQATRGLMPLYSFAPDGKSLVIGYNGKINRVDIASGKAENIPFAAKVNLAIGPDLRGSQKDSSGPVRSRLIQTPVQSPDGEQLAFSTFGHIYVQSLGDERSAKKLSSGEGGGFLPAWSPDGKWIAYVSWANGQGYLWKVRANGRGKPERLTDVPAYYTSPIFSRDGKSIYALRASASDRANYHLEVFGGLAQVQDIIAVPANGGLVKRVTSITDAGTLRFSNDLNNLHWGADPQRIYFYAGGNVGSVRLDGIDRRTILKIQEPDTRVDNPAIAQDVRISPNGKWALALMANQLHLIAVPGIGGESVVDLTSPTVAHKKLTDIGADYFNWADGGNTVTWSIGSTFYRRAFADIAFDDNPAGNNDAQHFTVVVEKPRDIPQGTVVLRGATAITMNGDEIIENADVVIAGNRIQAIGATGSVDIPNGVTIRDVDGKYIVPGFIDTHAHWNHTRRGILDKNAWGLAMNIAYGVTSGLDVQPLTNDIIAYKDLIDAGEMLGPRTYTTSVGIFSSNRFENQEQVMAVLKRYKEHYGTRNIKAYMSGNRQQRQWVVNAAKELGMISTTEGAADMAMDLTHAIDGFAGNEHNLPVVPIFRDVAQLYGQTGIGYSPTLMVTYGGPAGEEAFFTSKQPHEDPKVNRFMAHSVIDARTRRRHWFHPDEYTYPRVAEGAAKIYRAGGRVGIGAHGEFQGLAYHWEMEALAAGGLSPHEVLRIATRQSSEIIGRSAELGTLETGKYADLLVLDKNPLADITNTTALGYVMKNGRLYEADTMNEVWPRQRKYSAYPN